MKSTLVLLLALGWCGSVNLRAQSVVQSVNFSESTTYPAVSGSVQHVDASFFLGTFDPFNDALGTLDSFQIEWNLTNTGTGNFGGSGGSISLSVVGALTLNGSGYHNAVTGNDATGGPPNGAFSLSAPIAVTDAFLVSGAGTDYDSAYLAALTGNSTFTLGYTAPVNFSVSGLATFDASTLGSATLTYNYTPAAVPEPSTYTAIFGTLALAAACFRRRSRARLVTS